MCSRKKHTDKKSPAEWVPPACSNIRDTKLCFETPPTICKLPLSLTYKPITNSTRYTACNQQLVPSFRDTCRTLYKPSLHEHVRMHSLPSSLFFLTCMVSTPIFPFASWVNDWLNAVMSRSTLTPWLLSIARSIPSNTVALDILTLSLHKLPALSVQGPIRPRLGKQNHILRNSQPSPCTRTRKDIAAPPTSTKFNYDSLGMRFTKAIASFPDFRRLLYWRVATGRLQVRKKPVQLFVYSALSNQRSYIRVSTSS